MIENLEVKFNIFQVTSNIVIIQCSPRIYINPELNKMMPGLESHNFNFQDVDLQ